MKYIQEILWYLVLPMTVVVSYYAVLFGIKKFEKLQQKSEDTEK
ncbi:hypothetical protein [Carboxylicivirga taeanensis]